MTDISTWHNCWLGFLRFGYVSPADAARFDAMSEHITLWSDKTNGATNWSTTDGIRSSTNPSNEVLT